jgi:hypothetical protein
MRIILPKNTYYTKLEKHTIGYFIIFDICEGVWERGAEKSKSTQV